MNNRDAIKILKGLKKVKELKLAAQLMLLQKNGFRRVRRHSYLK